MTSLKSAILILALITHQQCNAENFTDITNTHSTFELSNSSIILPVEDPGEDVINILFPNENDLSENDSNENETKIIFPKENDSINRTDFSLISENSTDKTVTTSEAPLEILDLLFPHKHSEENTTNYLNLSMETTSEVTTDASPEASKETPLEILDILFPHKHSGVNNSNSLMPTIETTTQTITETSKENLLVDDFIYMLFEEKLSEKVVSSTTTASEIANKTSDHNLFAVDLFSVIAETKLSENVVYSPASIQICLALAYMGAEGETAERMREILRLGKGDKLDVAISYNEFLKVEPNSENVAEDMPILKMANRLYINEIVNISQDFNEIARRYFNAETEKVNFNDAENSVEKINKWIEEQTENKIQNLLNTKDVSVDTNAVLVNAIYFKAKWLNPFSLSSSYNSKFYINENKTQDVDFMYNEEYFAYADLPDLKASALEMPYENSDLSMLLILPYDIEGLEKLEIKLRGLDLNDITSQMKHREVEVHLPRFKIEFDIDLKEPLEKLGLTNLFDKNANFKGIFHESEFQSISEVKHKAYLDVNEAGSEAAAATFSTLVTLSAPFDVPTFRANHPFVFAIRSKSAVYFAGHVASI